MKKIGVILFLLLVCLGNLCAQDNYDACAVSTVTDNHPAIATTDTSHSMIGAEVHFRLDNYILDLEYMGNRVSLKNLKHKIDSIGVELIDSIVICSQSSPEGVWEHNIQLSKNRARAMRRYIDKNCTEWASLVTVYPDGESWLQLREYVRTDTLMKNSTIDKVLKVIDSDVNMGTKKWRMKQLPVYRYLLATYYPRIRNSMVCIIYHSKKTPAVSTQPLPLPLMVGDVMQVPVVPPIGPNVDAIETLLPDAWMPHFYIKTNLAAWGLAISNIAVEADVAPHWSVALPVYYSAWDYFRETVKFRTFAIQPEARYWLNRDNVGFFAGAHLGMIYYNFAFNGDLRYQDHNGCSPAWGGGISLGYRTHIDKNKHWHAEFAVGAGAYSLYYDTFYNTPMTKYGVMTGTHKDVYWGIDQVAITISYRFDLLKKGGMQ